MSATIPPPERRGPLTLLEAFDPRANSIGFLRWLMAFSVILSHAGPLAGFYHGEDLGTQISSEQSLGGVAVAGFFFFSGFLITQSRRGSSTIFRYFWRRCLRIFPAFWSALLLTCFVLAPIAWRKVHGTWSGFFSTDTESPWTYVSNNFTLQLHQRGIAGLGDSIPYGVHGHDWNGAAWTLVYEFRGYILIGLLGLFAILEHRLIASLAALMIVVANGVTWSGIGDASRISTSFTDPYVAMLLAPMAFGILFALWGDKIPIDDRLAVFGLVVALFTYDRGGWNVWGQYGLLYFLMWFAIRATWLRRWERFGDFSYGIYIFAWPLMQFFAYFGLQKHGLIVYHLVIIVAVHVVAFLSWHLIEKPAMSLKDWTPKPVAAALAWGRPYVNSVKAKLIDPRFSSAPFARRGTPGAARLRPHLPLERGLGHYAFFSALVLVVATLCVVGASHEDRPADQVAAAAHTRIGLPAVCHPAYDDPVGDPWNPSDPSTRQASEAVYSSHVAKEDPLYVRGKDGWVFYADVINGNFSQGLGRLVIDDKQVEAWAKFFNAMSAHAKTVGSDFFVVIAPAKWEIMSSELPDWAQPLRGPRSMDKLISAHPELPIIDTRELLRDAASAHPTYSPLNSHWTNYGAALAWNQIAACMKATDPKLDDLSLPPITGVTLSKDESEYTAKFPTPETPVWSFPEFAEPIPVADGTDLAGTHAIDVTDGVNLGELPARTTTSSAPDPRTLLLARDSTGDALSQWAQASFQNTVQVSHLIIPSDNDPNPPLTEAMDTYHPDVTIFLMTERYLGLAPPAVRSTPK